MFFFTSERTFKLGIDCSETLSEKRKMSFLQGFNKGIPASRNWNLNVQALQGIQNNSYFVVLVQTEKKTLKKM